MALSNNFLIAAEILLEDVLPTSGARRRAASTAYYALFHRLCELCAWILMGVPDREPTPSYRRAYRALDHGKVREALARSDEFRAQIGAAFLELQDIREWADYSSTPHPNDAQTRLREAFSVEEARASVERAREAIARIDQLDLGATRRLATLLLVRERR